MLFNSLDFAFYLPLVFAVYWFVFNKNLKHQNLWLLFASYVFYGWWDWRFLILIFSSSLVDYYMGIWLAKEERPRQRKWYLYLSLLFNLGLLGVFKYYNFFVDSFVTGFSFFGMELQTWQLDLILPVGISFYTFQTLSYTIDVYRKKMEPTRDFASFFAFVSFFPQLVAGPIEKASHLLPQFYRHRTFDKAMATDGLRQILWGLFKKVVIADNCAKYVDMTFDYTDQYSGSTLVLGVALFAVQAYGDFSGYSDIAIGTSKLFGFDLMKNFNFPFFSRNMSEFWRRWHMSLNRWFTDYLYFPLGGSRGGVRLKIRNIFIVFVVSALWHGADWIFVVFGFLNALFFLPYILFKGKHYDTESDVVAKGKYLPSLKEGLMMCSTVTVFSFPLIFFRSTNIADAYEYLIRIFDPALLSVPAELPIRLILLVFVFFSVEWLQRERPHGLYFSSGKVPKPVRWGAYLLLSFLIASFFGNSYQTFIYFQF